MKAIVSLRELCWTLGIPRERLFEIARNPKSHYRVWLELDTAKGKAREYQAPSEQLKEIQRRIITNILAEFELSHVAHGSVKGRSFRTNAEAHLYASTVVNVDVRNFFPRVSYKRVFEMFRRDFQFGTGVASLLTKLVTFKGRLPTGAPTSPAVSNALLTVTVDRPLQERAGELGVVYTRYVDDLTFSGRNARLLINEAGVLLSRLGLRIWRENGKLKITRNGARQSVTGLVVNSKSGPSVGRPRIDDIRRSIHNLGRSPKLARNSALASLHGRINHVRQFNDGAGRRLARQLEAVLASRQPGGRREGL